MKKTIVVLAVLAAVGMVACQEKKAAETEPENEYAGRMEPAPEGGRIPEGARRMEAEIAPGALVGDWFDSGHALVVTLDEGQRMSGQGHDGVSYKSWHTVGEVRVCMSGVRGDSVVTDTLYLDARAVPMTLSVPGTSIVYKKRMTVERH